MDDPRNLAERLRARTYEYYRLVDAGDVEGVLDWFAVDAEYHRPGYESLRGRAALGAFYRGTRVIESGRHRVDSVLVDDVEDGARVAARGRFEGVLKGGGSASAGFADFIEYRSDDDGVLRAGLRLTYFDAPAL